MNDTRNAAEALPDDATPRRGAHDAGEEEEERLRSIEQLTAEGRRRPRAPARPEITFETSPQVIALLDDLARSGLYPADRGAVAEELLREKLRELEVAGRLR